MVTGSSESAVSTRMFSIETTNDTRNVLFNDIYSTNQRHECNEQHIDTYNTRIVHSLLYSSHMYIPRYRRYLKPFWKRDGLDVDHHNMRERRREWKDDGENRDPDSI